MLVLCYYYVSIVLFTGRGPTYVVLLLLPSCDEYCRVVLLQERL